MKIDLIKIGFGMIVLFLSILALIYGLNQMQSKDATEVAFYGLISLLIVKESFWSIRNIIDGINKDASLTKNESEGKHNE